MDEMLNYTSITYGGVGKPTDMDVRDHPALVGYLVLVVQLGSCKGIKGMYHKKNPHKG